METKTQTQKIMAAIVLAIMTAMFYIASSILGQELYIPYIAAVIFTILYAICASRITKGDIPIITAICTIVLSIGLFIIANWGTEEIMKYQETTSWDARNSNPLSITGTWSWNLQIIISILIGLLTYKLSPKIGKMK